MARRFYLLFQQHATYWNAGSISKTLGEFSYHQVRSLGHNMLLLVPDTRSERTTTQVSTPLLHPPASPLPPPCTSSTPAPPGGCPTLIPPLA